MGTRSLSSRPGRIVTRLPVRKDEQATAIVRVQILSRFTLHWSDGTVTTVYPPTAGLPL
jgi:hypothetical protein